MRIILMSQQECSELLQRVSIGRLACSLNDQPYMVPVAFSYEPDCIYIFSTSARRLSGCGKIQRFVCKRMKSATAQTGLV
jgi:nitroimidazol reductase NimA-like FMN-containing flavoprotein (pyridoxamine 5'-phosphate oxidase superfamily)